MSCYLQVGKSRNTTASSSTTFFSDEEDTGQMLSSSKSVGRGRKGTSDVPKPARAGTSKSGRGRGSGSLKQMTLQATLRTQHSERLLGSLFFHLHFMSFLVFISVKCLSAGISL